MAKNSSTTGGTDSDTARIKAAVAGQSKPVNHPGATYKLARMAQDAQANGVGRRLAAK